MTSQYPITVRYSLPQTGQATGNEFWLRMEQETGDDRLSLATAAEIVDAAFRITPCEPTEEKTSDEIQARNDSISQQSLTQFLASVASKADIAECARRSTGDYTAVLRIIRSHLEEEYELKLSVGAINGTQKVEEKITLTVNVNEQSSALLDYPVAQKEVNGELIPRDWPGTAKWLGSVYSKEFGPIPPPRISGYKNALSWGGNCTGTIITTFRTFYDLATLNIPGIPGTNGATVGSSQNSTARAFYNHQVYEQEITMVVADTGADQETLAEVCGWANLGGDGGVIGDFTGGSESESDGENGDDAGASDDGPKIGCLQRNTNLSDADFYHQICCKENSYSSDCAQFATARPVKPIDNAAMERYRGQHHGKVNFVAIGPGPEGCGRLITSVNIRPKQCCEDVDPIEIDAENTSDSIFIGGTANLAATGGAPPYYWESNGGYTLSNGTTNQTTYSYPPTNIVHASNNYVCGDASIRLRDICSATSFTIPQEDPVASLKLPDNIIMSPDSEHVVVLANGDAPPFVWTAADDLSWQYAETMTPTNTLISSADFCGTGQIGVSDNCANTDQAGVRSTDGAWETVSAPIPPGVWCSCVETGGASPTQTGATLFESVGDGFRCQFEILVDIWRSECPSIAINCDGQDSMDILKDFCESGQQAGYSYPPEYFTDDRPCCELTVGAVKYWGKTGLIINKQQWVCS